MLAKTARGIDAALKFFGLLGLSGYALALLLILMRAPREPLTQLGETHPFFFKGGPTLYVTPLVSHLMTIWFVGMFVILLSLSLLQSLLRTFKPHDPDVRQPAMLVDTEGEGS